MGVEHPVVGERYRGTDCLTAEVLAVGPAAVTLKLSTGRVAELPLEVLAAAGCVWKRTRRAASQGRKRTGTKAPTPPEGVPPALLPPLAPVSPVPSVNGEGERPPHL